MPKSEKSKNSSSKRQGDLLNSLTSSSSSSMLMLLQTIMLPVICILTVQRTLLPATAFTTTRTILSIRLFSQDHQPSKSSASASSAGVIITRRMATSSSNGDNNDNIDTEQTRTTTHTVTWNTKKKSDLQGNDGEEDDESTSTTFQVYHGETLRTAALRRNIVSPHNGRANLINCRGLGTCGTCAVEIESSTSGDDNTNNNNNNYFVDPPQRNQIEDLRFNFPPHSFHNNTKLRLACQVQVCGDIIVTKRTGFWGQKDNIAEPSQPELYFGDLEYLLDNKSPSVEKDDEEQPKDK